MASGGDPTDSIDMERTDVGIQERTRARAAGPRDAVLASLLHSPVEVCAFCLQARAPGGPWMPVGHLLPAEDGPGVRKTICERCGGES